MKTINTGVLKSKFKNHLSFGISGFCFWFSLLLPMQTFAEIEVESRNVNQPMAQVPGSFQPATTHASLDMLKKMEFLQQELQELRGKMEEQNHQMQQLQDHQKKLYLDLDRRLREGGPAKVSGISSVSLQDRNNSAPLQGTIDARVAAPFSETTTVTAPVTALPNSEESALEEKTYQHAYHLIQNKDYEGALMAFKTLINQFPRGKYVPNAHYWLGEIYCVKGDLDSAALAFDTVYRQYPQHPKAADSLLKLGYVEYSKGRFNQSKSLLNQVKAQFPGSTSAQLAESRLNQMKKEGVGP